jgi:hypothetical protein
MVCWIAKRIRDGVDNLNTPPTEEELKMHAEMHARGLIPPDEIKIEPIVEDKKKKKIEV